MVYIATIRHLVALDANQGTVRWCRGRPENRWFKYVPATDGKRVYVDGYGFETSTGDLVWNVQSEVDSQVVGPPAVVGELAVVGTDSQLLAVDAANGERLAAIDLPGSVPKPPVTGDGRVYIGAGDVVVAITGKH